MSSIESGLLFNAARPTKEEPEKEGGLQSPGVYDPNLGGQVSKSGLGEGVVSLANSLIGPDALSSLPLYPTHYAGTIEERECLHSILGDYDPTGIMGPIANASSYQNNFADLSQTDQYNYYMKLHGQHTALASPTGDVTMSELMSSTQQPMNMMPELLSSGPASITISGLKIPAFRSIPLPVAVATSLEAPSPSIPAAVAVATAAPIGEKEKAPATKKRKHSSVRDSTTAEYTDHDGVEAIPKGTFSVCYADSALPPIVNALVSANNNTARSEFAMRLYWKFTSNWVVEPRRKDGPLEIKNIIDYQCFRSLDFEALEVDNYFPETTTQFEAETLYCYTLPHYRVSTGEGRDGQLLKMPSFSVPVSRFVVPEGRHISDYQLLLFVKPKNGFCTHNFKNKKIPFRLAVTVGDTQSEMVNERWLSTAFITTSKAFPGLTKEAAQAKLQAKAEKDAAANDISKPINVPETNGNPTRAVHERKLQEYRVTPTLGGEWIDNGSEGTKKHVCFHSSDNTVAPLVDSHGRTMETTPLCHLKYIKTYGFITASGENQKALWCAKLNENYVGEFLTNNSKSKSFFHFRMMLASSCDLPTIEMIPCSNDLPGGIAPPAVLHANMVAERTFDLMLPSMVAPPAPPVPPAVLAMEPPVKRVKKDPSVDIAFSLLGGQGDGQVEEGGGK
jgi:hypothetical protein